VRIRILKIGNERKREIVEMLNGESQGIMKYG
jgi:hypothetical protein